MHGAGQLQAVRGEKNREHADIAAAYLLLVLSVQHDNRGGCRGQTGSCHDDARLPQAGPRQQSHQRDHQSVDERGERCSRPDLVFSAGVVTCQLLRGNREGHKEQPDERPRNGGAAAEEVMEADRDHRLKVPGGAGPSIRPRPAIGSAGIGSVDRSVVLVWLPSSPRTRASEITGAVHLTPCLQRSFKSAYELLMRR